MFIQGPTKYFLNSSTRMSYFFLIIVFIQEPIRLNQIVLVLFHCITSMIIVMTNTTLLLIVFWYLQRTFYIICKNTDKNLRWLKTKTAIGCYYMSTRIHITKRHFIPLKFKTIFFRSPKKILKSSQH